MMHFCAEKVRVIGNHFYGPFGYSLAVKYPAGMAHDGFSI